MKSNQAANQAGCRITLALLFALLFFWGFPGKCQATTDAPVILSAAEADYPPFSIVDDNGHASGFAVELMRAALDAMGREVTFRTGPWAQVRTWLEQGEIAALPLVGRTPERELLFDFTFPYMSLHGAIVVRKGARGINDLKDLKGRQVAVMKGDNAEEFLRRKDRGIDIRTTPTFENALRQLSEGRHDAVFIQRLVALRLIRQAGFINLEVIKSPVEGFRQDFCFAVKEGDRDTLALLNEGLAVVIADGTRRRLHAEWFAAMELPIRRKLIVGGDNNYPPYEFIDENGRPAGYNVDLIRAIAGAVGLDIEIRLGPWYQVRKALARGEIDVLQGMYYSAQRDLTFDFTPPYTVNHNVSVVRKGEGSAPGTIEELAGKRIVVQQGDIMHDFALENGLAAQVTAVEAPEDALSELAAGKHDCALIARRIALYWIDKKGWENLTVGKTPLLSSEYCFAVQNNRKALLGQLSDGLEIIENTGEYRRIQEKWLGGYEALSPDFTKIIRYVGWIIGPLLLLVFGFFLWSWSLRKQVAKKTGDLRKSEAQYRLIAENMANVITVLDMDLNFTYVSPSIIRLREFTVEEAMEQRLDQIMTPDSLAQATRVFEEELRLEAAGTADPARSRVMELEEYKKDGSTIWVENTMSFMRDENQAPVGIIVVSHDITEKKKLQEQLNQSQKMEAIGTLAGGIAHDFNNILSSIIGYTELSIDDAEKGSVLEQNLKTVYTAGIRAKKLVQQILTVSRHDTSEIKPVQVVPVIQEAVKMLRATIPTSIAFQENICSDPLVVKAGPTQLHQIVVNLVTNARHAMADGTGVLEIGVDKITFESDIQNRYLDMRPGDYARITVSDTGIGIPKNNLEKIFEPYFTTKEKGTGTGLGLSVVHAIVKNANGHITVYSKPGKGTTVHVYLPLIEQAEIEQTERQTEMIPTGTERILLVDDEASVVNLQQQNLSRLGYTVATQTSSTAALAAFQASPTDFDLIITDMTMPEMTGDKLAREIKAIRPDVPVILCTGFSEKINGHGKDLNIDAFLMKPFDRMKMAKTVRSVLDKT